LADIFDTISAWLLQQGFSSDDNADTLRGFCNRLVDGGIRLARISVGRAILHPVIGLNDMVWDRETDQIETGMQSAAHALNTINALFSAMSRGKVADVIADLTDPAHIARFPIFAERAAAGSTGHDANMRIYGTRQDIFGAVAENFRGGPISFATKRCSGFSPSGLEGLERLITPLSSACASPMTGLWPRKFRGPIWGTTRASRP